MGFSETPRPSISLAWPDRLFSFGVGAEKNKGLAYYRCMFCAENRQILAIVDWPLIGVNSLQRCSTRMTYKAVYKV